MQRAHSGKGDAILWPKAKSGEARETDWREFIKSEGLSASVDYPMSLYWKDLVELYPNAKVLLTVRDPVRWYTSVKNTIRQSVSFVEESWVSLPLLLLMKLRGKKSFSPAMFTVKAPTYLGPKYPSGLFGAIDAGEEIAVQFYNDWNTQVMKEVPADRLLVFEVKEGWGPLCKFLGVPEPDTPFPNTNDTNYQQRKLRIMKTMCYSLWSLAAAVTAVSAFMFKDSIRLPTISF